MSEVSNHPVHMIDQNGFLMPSSLIPFCSLGTQLELLGEYVTNMTLPVCNAFLPTVYEGQLCYKLEISNILSLKRDLSQGKESGIMMLLDMNNEKSLEIEDKVQGSKSELHNGTMSLANIQKNIKSQAKIHIGTLAPFTCYGPGDYKLFSLKQTTGTKSFLAKPDNEKDCINEKFEKCQMQRAK